MSIELYRASLRKEELMKLPEEDRALLLGLAHLCNEITLVLKLSLISNKDSPSNDAQRDGSTTIMFFFLNLLSGKLLEGHKILKNHYFKCKSLAKYYEKLSKEAKDSFDLINQYFSKRNTLSDVRNNFAFHYSPNLLNETLPNTSDDLALYVERNGRGNNLYYFAEVAANFALLGLINNQDFDEARIRLMNDTIKVSQWFMSVCDEFIILILQENLKSNFWNGYAKHVELETPPLMASLKLPWFVDYYDGFENHPTIKHSIGPSFCLKIRNLVSSISNLLKSKLPVSKGK